MFPASGMLPSGFHPPPQPLPPPLPPPWLHQLLSPQPPGVGSLWKSEILQNHLRNSRETLNLLKAVKKELELVHSVRERGGCTTEGDDECLSPFVEEIKRRRIGLDAQELLSLESAKALYSTLKDQLAPLSAITNQTGPWEERSEAVKLAQKLQKYKRNKQWKKRKRRRVAEMLRKEREMYDKVDGEADEWRTREIAKDMAKRKVEKMEEIAKLKANEERKRLESEFELVLVVEKLQELRAIRIQKLKKQGHFLPEEDDEFLERVRAAVEEEERQAAAAADTDAAKDAIANAEESRRNTQNIANNIMDMRSDNTEVNTDHNQLSRVQDERSSPVSMPLEPEQQGPEGQGHHGGGYDLVSNLPLEFYHYYHGSNYDMGTLIEVRRTWDAYIRPGGSRIPGHWVQPPPPANEVWASYLVSPKK